MPQHHVERRLPYAPRQLFDLVGDVARYPEFVPWITAMRVEPTVEIAAGVETQEAEAAVGFAFLTERFTTAVRRDANALVIQVDLVRGPFRRLANRWRFEATADNPCLTSVVFDIDFAFKRRLLDLMLMANVDKAVGRLIGCFEARAAALYGSGSGPSSPTPHRRLV